MNFNHEKFPNPLRLYIATLEIPVEDKVVEQELVYIKPPIETCLPAARIEDLEQVDLLPKNRWQTKTSPLITVFNIDKVRDFGGREISSAREAAMNLGSIILSSMSPDEIDVVLFHGPSALEQLYNAEV